MALLAASIALGLTSAYADNARPANAQLPRMIDIPAGSFVMGAAPDDDVQQGKPQHKVTIRAFRIAETLVTWDQYEAFAKATDRPLPQDENFGRGTRPVINLVRADMLAYIDWLNQASGQTGFRLPTEAEWEYAARAGTTTPFFWGTKLDSRYANTSQDIPPDIYKTTSPVKAFLPNPWGLYDMAGNVWQEVQDCRHGDYVGAPTDGSAWMEKGCYSYIVRGGTYDHITRGIKATARGAVGATFPSMSVGFRVAQDHLTIRPAHVDRRNVGGLQLVPVLFREG